MTELVKIDLYNFVSAKLAADRVGYSSDYVTRLAREGKVVAKKVGRQWLVDLDSVKLFTLEVEAERRRRQAELHEQRRLEQLATKHRPIEAVLKTENPRLRRLAILETFVVFGCVALLFVLGAVSRTNYISSDSLVDGIFEIQTEFQTAMTLSSLSPILDFSSWWWLVREEKVVKSNHPSSDSGPDIVSRENISTDNSTHYSPQVEVDTGVLVVSTGDVVSDDVAEFVASSFSDNTLIQFADSRRGTVTPVFRTSPGNEYPFRLVAKPEHN